MGAALVALLDGAFCGGIARSACGLVHGQCAVAERSKKARLRDLPQCAAACRVYFGRARGVDEGAAKADPGERGCGAYFGGPVVDGGQRCEVHAYAVGLRRQEAGCGGEAFVLGAALGGSA